MQQKFPLGGGEKSKHLKFLESIFYELGVTTCYTGHSHASV